MRAVIASAFVLAALVVGCGSGEQRALDRLRETTALYNKCTGDCKAEQAASSRAYLNCQKLGISPELVNAAMAGGSDEE
jgi:hypothetical protein